MFLSVTRCYLFVRRILHQPYLMTALKQLMALAPPRSFRTARIGSFKKNLLYDFDAQNCLLGVFGWEANFLLASAVHVRGVRTAIISAFRFYRTFSGYPTVGRSPEGHICVRLWTCLPFAYNLKVCLLCSFKSVRPLVAHVLGDQ